MVYQMALLVPIQQYCTFTALHEGVSVFGVQWWKGHRGCLLRKFWLVHQHCAVQKVTEQGAVGRAGHCSTADCEHVEHEVGGAGRRFNREALGTW